MKKSLIGGIAAAAVVVGAAGGVTAFALSSEQPEPTAPAAPVASATTTAEATASATPEPTDAPIEEPVATDYPDADEGAYLEAVRWDWQSGDVPDDVALLEAGYEVCDAIAESRVFDDERFPEWSGQNNFAVHFMAERHLCLSEE